MPTSKKHCTLYINDPPLTKETNAILTGGLVPYYQACTTIPAGTEIYASYNYSDTSMMCVGYKTGTDCV